MWTCSNDKNIARTLQASIQDKRIPASEKWQNAFYDNISKFLISKECGKFCPCSRCSLSKGYWAFTDVQHRRRRLSRHIPDHTYVKYQIPNIIPDIKYILWNTKYGIPNAKKQGVYWAFTDVKHRGSYQHAIFQLTHISNTKHICQIQHPKCQERCVLINMTANMAHSRTHISAMTESLCGDWKEGSGVERSSSDIMWQLWHSITRRH